MPKAADVLGRYRRRSIGYGLTQEVLSEEHIGGGSDVYPEEFASSKLWEWEITKTQKV